VYEDAPEPDEIHVSGLQAGDYTAKVRIGEAPPSRHDFACERGGSAFADSRPDRPRLEAISRVTSGISVDVPGVPRLPLPEATSVSAERQVAPMLPPWVWTLTSAVLLGEPAGVTRVISIAAATAAFEEYDYSMASAIAMIMGFVQLGIVVAVLASRGLFYRGPASGAKG